MDEAKRIINEYNTLKQKLVKIAIGVLVLQNVTNLTESDFDSLDVTGDIVDVGFSNYRCGETENWYAEFPLSYLENNDWPKLEKERLRVQRENKERERQKEIELQRAMQEKTERDLLRQLKKKYEPAI